MRFQAQNAVTIECVGQPRRLKAAKSLPVAEQDEASYDLNVGSTGHYRIIQGESKN